MARKYKFHKTYAVMWFDRRDTRWHYKYFLTKKEAKALALPIEIIKEEIVCVEIVKRLLGYDYYEGRIPLEAL